jgi:hypothetical protein
MFRKIFFLSICAGIFSSVACIVYNRVYHFAFGTDYSRLVNEASLIGINLFACLLAGIGYWVMRKLFGDRGEIIFNISFTFLSFASILAPLAISLPLEVQNPELFPGLAVPMLFFPAMGWYTLKPIFIKETSTHTT